MHGERAGGRLSSSLDCPTQAKTRLEWATLGVAGLCSGGRTRASATTWVVVVSLRLGRLQWLAGEGSFDFAQDRSATTQTEVDVLPISFVGLFC
jgi:hypothetical protein